MFRSGQIQIDARFSDLYVDYIYRVSFVSSIRLLDGDVQEIMNYAEKICEDVKLRDELYKDIVSLAPKSFKDV